jgi:hypothetical protein
MIDQFIDRSINGMTARWVEKERRANYKQQKARTREKWLACSLNVQIVVHLIMTISC